MYDWVPNQANRITFVMVDLSDNEVSGLGAGFTLEIGKNGGAFVASAGTKAEMANGWYSYVSTASEADTMGPVSIRVNGAGCKQQNLEYVVSSRAANIVTLTYVLTEPPEGTGVPIAGALVIVTTDAAGAHIVTQGETDASGHVVFYLAAGTYYLWRSKAGYVFTNPDQEAVV